MTVAAPWAPVESDMTSYISERGSLAPRLARGADPSDDENALPRAKVYTRRHSHTKSHTRAPPARVAELKKGNMALGGNQHARRSKCTVGLPMTEQQWREATRLNLEPVPWPQQRSGATGLNMETKLPNAHQLQPCRRQTPTNQIGLTTAPNSPKAAPPWG